MSFARKQAIISFSVWLLISIVFFGLFFSVGAESFAYQNNKITRLVVALVILPGYILNVVGLQRKKRGFENGDLDERDEVIAHKASEVTLTMLAMLIFGFGMGLYIANSQAGVVPVGWLYFLAYGSMSVICMVHPAVTLVLDYGGKVDG